MGLYSVLFHLFEKGSYQTVRGLKTVELTDFRYVLEPYHRFMSFDARKLNLDYIKQEFLWYLCGDKYDVSIRKVASMWDSLINVDGTINSNYGYYIFNPETGRDGKSNFDRVVETLKEDQSSRRAVITILGNTHLNTDTNDYPCTAYLNFLIRDRSLVMLVRMRSQDAIYGMGNDAPFFSFVQELLYVSLKSQPGFEDLKMGPYSHIADSFHAYERHFEMLDSICEDPQMTDNFHDSCPQMTTETPKVLKEVKFHLERGLSMDSLVGKDPFVDWLLTRNDVKSMVYPERLTNGAIQ